VKPIEVEGVEKWEVKKILNKRKVRGVVKYLVLWCAWTLIFFFSFLLIFFLLIMKRHVTTVT